MEYSLTQKNEVLKIYQNVINLLEDRGIPSSTLGKYISLDTIDFKIHYFLESSDADSTYIDLHINDNGRNTYVKFLRSDYFGQEINFGRSGFLSKFDKLLEFIKNVANLDNNDEIIVVMINKSLDKDEKKNLSLYESSHPYLRVFGHKDLLINIARHNLVPKHSVFKGNKRNLFEKLMINGTDQLPYILHSDPISRYFNFRHNQIIEVLRPTKCAGFIKVYRACIDENLSKSG